jgi:hypothetical protein
MAPTLNALLGFIRRADYTQRQRRDHAGGRE